MRKHLVNASPRHHVPAKKDSHGSANRLYRDGFTRTRVPSSTGRRERNGLGGLLVGLARAETISVHTVRSASHPISLAILSLIELTLKPSLVVRPPKSLTVTIAN